MKLKLTALVAVFVMLLGSSCATLFNSNLQTVSITSSNGKPFVGKVNGYSFSGPGDVKISRNRNDLIISTSTKGCATSTVVPVKVSSLFWLNALNLFIYALEDYGSGEMWEYDAVVIQCN